MRSYDAWLETTLVEGGQFLSPRGGTVRHGACLLPDGQAALELADDSIVHLEFQTTPRPCAVPWTGS